MEAHSPAAGQIASTVGVPERELAALRELLEEFTGFIDPSLLPVMAQDRYFKIKAVLSDIDQRERI